MNITALLACTVGLAAAPGIAPAYAQTTTDVTGVVSSELSVSVSTPPTPMVLSRSTPGTSAAVVSVVSTTPWTLTIHDAGSTTPGRMDKVNCVTKDAGSGSLNNALKWSNTTEGTGGTLSGTPATLATGSLLGTVAVGFTQPLGAAEAVSANDCYQLTTTFTVS